jgi:hypothetical protein
MEQIMEFLKADREERETIRKADEAKMEAARKELLAKMEADRKADQEKAEADRKIDRDERKADQERMEARRREIIEMMKVMNSNHNETSACRETTEERLVEKKPTSPDRKPEAAQKTEVPVDDSEVMPVGGPKKKRRKDRKLAAEHRRQKPKTSTRENCGSQKRLAVARRGTSHHAPVARQKDKRIDNGMSRHATVAQRKRDIVKSYITQIKCRARRELVASRTRTGHRAGVVRRKENAIGKVRVRDNVVRGTWKGWTHGRKQQMSQEGNNLTRNRDLSSYGLQGK